MQLNYKEYGSGEPLIILHGFLGSLDNWHTLATKFGAYFRTFAIDQRNHGKSFHSETHSLQLMVDDLKEFIELNQLDSELRFDIISIILNENQCEIEHIENAFWN